MRYMDMGTFDSFRDGIWNTYYTSERHSAAIYVTHVIIAYFAVIVGTSLLIVTISSRGKERWGPLLRLIFNLHTATSILLSITGQNWVVSSVHTHCDYTATLSVKIHAIVGIQVGLKSVNISLIADTNTSSAFGDIYYNERFNFVGVSDLQTAVHDAHHKGLPYALLYVAGYFEEDAGGLRWSRIFRSAGHFVFIVLWTALVFWTVAQILTSFVITSGASLNAVCGVFMCGACVLYHFLQPTSPLIIPFQDGFMQLHYGWSFWLCCGSGLCTVLYSLVVISLRRWFPVCTAAVFLADASVEASEAKDVRPVIAPLQIMTPYQERKKKHDLYKNIFDNPAFSHDSDFSMNMRQSFSLPPDYSLSYSQKNHRRKSIIEEDIFKEEPSDHSEMGSSTMKDSPSRDVPSGCVVIHGCTNSETVDTLSKRSTPISDDDTGSGIRYPPPDYSSESENEAWVASPDSGRVERVLPHCCHVAVSAQSSDACATTEIVQPSVNLRH